MWSQTIPATNFVLLWLLIITTAFLGVGGKLQTESIFLRVWKKKVLLGLLLLALVIRLLPMLLLPVGAGYDIASFQLVAEALLNGEEVYTSAAVGRHPYLPMQMYVIGGMFYMAKQTAVLPFVVWIKLPAVLADVAITAILYLYLTRLQSVTKQQTVGLTLLYVLNPISILVSAYHGQFDAIPVFLLLLSLYLYQFHQRFLLSATALGFAILNKTWPIVLLPILFLRLPNNRKRILYSIIAISIPILFTILYILYFEADPEPMLGRALTHTGNSGYWGWSAMLAVTKLFSPFAEFLFDLLVSMRRWLLLGSGILGLWLTRKQTALNALTTILLFELTVTAGIGIQWLLWVIPFGILVKEVKWIRWYALTGMLFLLAQLYGWHMVPWANRLVEPEIGDVIVRLASIPAWITSLLWLLSRLKRRNQYDL